jgi:hypothetical protein
MMRHVIVWMSVVLFHSCGDAQMLFEKLTGKRDGENLDEYNPVPGNPASDHLSKSFSDESTGVSSQVAAMNLAIEDEGRTNLIAQGLMLDGSQSELSASDETFDVLAGSEKKKRSLNPDGYQKLTNAAFKKMGLVTTDYTSDTVNWGSYTDTSFTIPALDQMPVRDQGRRGTCASFAGVGLIEALIIQANAASLPFKEIDLSEQRFYFLSKPDSWSSGGNINEQGSDSGDGFTRSNGQVSGAPAPTDTGGVAYNIPLEVNCPYNKALGANDLQTPLSEGCKTKGVVKITRFTAAAGTQGAANRISRAQSIYNELRSNKAVIVYTRLSSNWEKNDGFISYKGAGAPGGTGHADGHAYLVVGARKIDEGSFPGEGGMCFIIRNSWGTGWGAKGLSCMSLKWFNHWRFDTEFPTVDEVQLIDDAKNVITVASQRPAGLPEPDGATRQNRRGGDRVRRRGTVVISFAGQTSPWMPQDYGEDALTTLDLANLTADDMKFGKLVTDNDQTYKILYAATDTSLVLRGILSGDATQTHSLELTRSGNTLLSNFTGRGAIVVGEISSISGSDGSAAVVTLCGKKYASICDLNYVQESNELVIGLSEIEAKRETPVPPYNWQTVKLAGYGVQMNKPEQSLTKIDLRLLKNDTPTDPLRLKVDPKSGDISHQSNTIGNLAQGALCSGGFSSKCRVVSTGKRFEIFSKKAAQ